MRLVATDIEAAYEVTRPFRVPFHAGGMLHGIFGRALRSVVCPQTAASATNALPAAPTGDGRGPCSTTCISAPPCDWLRLFDPLPIERPSHRLLEGVATPPGPVMVIAPPPGALSLAPGQSWHIRWRLFGQARAHDLDTLERALAAVGSLAIGREQGGVALQAVTRFDPRHARVNADESFEQGSLKHRERAAMANTGASASAGHGAPRVKVSFETPVRLKRAGRPARDADIDFPELFTQMWRRLTMLCALYGAYGPEDDATFRHLRELSAAITTRDRHLREMRWEHLSVESGVHKPLRGLHGYMVFEGEALPALLPVLRAAELTQVGGATGLGLGRMKVDLI